MQERARRDPPAFDLALGERQHAADLDVREAGEETQLDEPGQLVILARERAQRFVDRQDLDAGILEEQRRLLEHDALELSAALLRAPPPGVIDQHVAHRARGEREEARLVLAEIVRRRLRRRADEPQPGLVHEPRRLERVARALSLHRALGQPVEPLVDQREELFRGGLVAAAHALEERGGVVSPPHGHPSILRGAREGANPRGRQGGKTARKKNPGFRGGSPAGTAPPGSERRWASPRLDGPSLGREAMNRRIPSISVLPCLALLSSAQSPGLVEPAQERPASFFWGDFDGDGLADAFVVGPSAEGRLLKNRGDGTLEDVTGEAGLAGMNGARFALWEDFDRDQDLDLFVGMPEGTSRLFANQGGAGFADATESAGLDPIRAALHGGFLDYDQDGLPDLHVRTEEESLLFHNLGAGLFERIELGLAAVALPLETGGTGEIVAQPATADAGEPARSTSKRALPHRPSGPEPDGTPGKLGRTPHPPVEVPEPRGIGGSFPGGELDGGICAETIEDIAVPGTCLFASSKPALGRLYPLSSNLFVDPASGFVGMNDTTPSSRLDVSENSFSTLAAVRAEGVEGPTRGYLAAQGAIDFDGVASADWSGHEIGVAGISTGTSATDNFGVVGHSNGVGVRGEFSGDPAGTFAELGTSNGVGIRADGSAMAAEFLGSVLVRAGNLVDGSVVVVDQSAIQRIRLSPSSFHDQPGVKLFNDAGQETIEISGGGSGWIDLRNQDGSTRMSLDGGSYPDFGASLEMRAADSSSTLFLDAEAANSGGLVSVRNDLSQPTIELIGDTGYGNSGAISLFDRTSNLSSVSLLGRDSAGGNGARLMLRGQRSFTVDIDANAGGAGGGSGGLKFTEDDGSVACDLFLDDYTFHNSAGATTISFNRQTGAKSAVVDTPTYGQRLFYCMESPEVWFEDFGTARLEGGEVRVELEAIFLESVTIDEKHPIKVFVTLHDDSPGVYVKKGLDHFVVRERSGGNGDVSFDWRVVAKRKNLESLRLEPYVEERGTQTGLGTGAPDVVTPEDG